MAPEIPKSGLYKQVYSACYGSPGARPYTAMILDYDIGVRDHDLVAIERHPLPRTGRRTRQGEFLSRDARQAQQR